MTTTDPLRGSLIRWHYLQAALIRSYGASFACMELTTICRFQRLAVTTLHQISIQIKFILSHFQRIAITKHNPIT